MKTIKIIIVLFISASMFTSCVSNRKYKEALSSRENLQQKYDDLQSQYATAMQQNQTLKNSSSEAEKGKLQTESALNEERKKLQDMKALIDAQRDAIKNLKQEVCSALKCFTPDELTIE